MGQMDNDKAKNISQARNPKNEENIKHPKAPIAPNMIESKRDLYTPILVKR